MKTMVLIETDKELAFVQKLWNQRREDIEARRDLGANCFGDGLTYTDNGAGGIKDCPMAIVYHCRKTENGDMVWDIYNFETGEKEMGLEGDLAGLANSKDGNFPFFN